MFGMFSKDLKDFVAATSQLVHGATTEDSEFYGDEGIPFYGEEPPLTGTSGDSSGSKNSFGGSSGGEGRGYHGDCPGTPLKKLQSLPATYDDFSPKEQEKYERHWCLAEENKTLVAAIAAESSAIAHDGEGHGEEQASALCEKILRRNPKSVAKYYDLYVAEQGKLSPQQFFERYFFRLTTTREQCSLSFRRQRTLKAAAEERFHEEQQMEDAEDDLEQKASAATAAPGAEKKGGMTPVVGAVASSHADPWATDEAEEDKTPSVAQKPKRLSEFKQTSQRNIDVIETENSRLTAEVARLNSLVLELQGQVSYLQAENGALKAVVSSQSDALSSPTTTTTATSPAPAMREVKAQTPSAAVDPVTTAGAAVELGVQAGSTPKPAQNEDVAPSDNVGTKKKEEDTPKKEEEQDDDYADWADAMDED